VHCTGIIAPESFEEFDLPDDSVLNGLNRVRFVSPSGLSVSYATTRAEATVIDRGRFDRALAARAEESGATIRTGARVSGLCIDEHGVTAMAGDLPVHARLVILACGASYGVQRRDGLGVPRE
jgi:flavin-dependent dehydrogenase